MRIINGETYSVDTYNVKQYEGKRITDTVTIVDEEVLDRKKWVLCYSPKLMANVLISRNDLLTK
jgi:hypothetical protein